MQLEDWEQKRWTSQLELLSQLVISSQQDLYSIIWNPYGNYCKEWQQMVLAFGGKDEENSVEQFVTSSSSWSLTSTSQVPRPSCVELGNLTNINHHGGEKHSWLWCQESLSAPKIRFDLKFWNLCVNLSAHKCSWSHDPIFFTHPTSQFFKLLHVPVHPFPLSLFREVVKKTVFLGSGWP